MSKEKRTRRFKSNYLHQNHLRRALEQLDMRCAAIRMNADPDTITHYKRQFDLTMDGLYIETCVGTKVRSWMESRRLAMGT